MVAASNRFAASYFDHPLASWWLELSSRFLFGSMAPIVVRLPFILLSALSSLLLFTLTDRLYGAKAGFWAVAAYSISPVFSLAFGSWVLPDGPLDFSLLAAAYALSRALGIARQETAPQPAWWMAAGFFAGLALLAKYNAALTLMGAVLLLLTEPVSRRQLRSFWPWAAGLPRGADVHPGDLLEFRPWLAVLPLPGRQGDRLSPASAGAVEHLGWRGVICSALALAAARRFADRCCASRTGATGALDAGDAGRHSSVAVRRYRYLVVDPVFSTTGPHPAI